MVTISEVARQAGVSTSTVSRALAGSASISPETVRRIELIATRLGYRPNAIAQSLRRRSTNTVGMVVPDLANPFFPAIVQAVEEALHDSGISLFLCDARDDADVEAARVKALLDRQVDGLIISPVDRTASVTAVRQAAGHTHVVQLDRRVDVPTDTVGVDHSAGIMAVIRHLAEMGRRRFAFVTTTSAISTAAERRSAYRKHVVTVDPDGPDRILVGTFSTEWGERAAHQLLTSGPLPDAVICANDLIAVGVLRTLRMHGVGVPDRVAVTGYDDGLLAAVCEPPLTSVRQPLGSLGQEAARLLLSGIADRALPPRSLRLRPVLVPRHSSVSTVDVPHPADRLEATAR